MVPQNTAPKANVNQMLDLLEGLEAARKVIANLANVGVSNVRKVTILGREPMFMFDDQDEPAQAGVVRR